MRNRSITWSAVAITALLLAGGCGDDEPGEISISDAWARTSPANAEAAAFYFVIDNGTDIDDEVTSASSDRCSRTELHRSAMSDEGVMSMAPAEPGELAVQSGASLVLEPGGLHVMCMGVTAPLVEGEELAVTIGFAKADDLDITVEVRAG